MKQFVIATTVIILFVSMIVHPLVIADPAERERLKQACMKNLDAIGKAILAYRADHKGEMPDWLSDLYPKYLQDPKLLLCPADKTKSVPNFIAAYKDPKMPCSYHYEFNPMTFLYEGGLFDINPPKDMTFKEYLTRALKYWGNLVPAVTCFHHGGFSRIDLGYDGKMRFTSLDGWPATPEAFKAVLSFFQRAIEVNPDGWEKDFSLQEIYVYFARYNRLPELRAILELPDVSSAFLRAFLEKDSNLPRDALKILAEFYQSGGKSDLAIEIYQRVIKQVPNDVETRLGLAKLYATEKNYRAARTELETALKLEPKNPKVHNLLAELDAISDASRLKKRFDQAGDPDVHYLIKLEENLSPSGQTLTSTVRKAREALGGSFGESASVTRLSHLYRTLDKSLASYSGGWKTYTTSDGLINDAVYTIAQDKRGILWIGTGKGVCTYDGERFTPFTLNEKLREASISSILIDKGEGIWFGTRGRGVFRYDGENVIHYSAEDGLAGDDVSGIIQDRNGSLWFAYNGGGIGRYDFDKLNPADFDTASPTQSKDGKTFTNFTTADGLAGNQVLKIIEDSRGALWIGTRHGVSRYGFDTPKATQPKDGKTFTNLTERDGLAGSEVFAIAEDWEGNLWFGTNQGISRYDGKKFTRFTTKDGLTVEKPIDIADIVYVSNILKDREENLWFTTWGQGVFRYDGRRFINFTTQDGLAGNSSSTVFEDREGNLWVGHSNWDGLSQFNPRGLKNYGVQDGLAGTAVYTITEDSHGNLWLATDGGVSQYDGATFTQPIAESRRVLGDVLAILADAKGHLWFGTYNRGLIRYDGKSFTHFTTLDGLVGNTIQTMMEDPKGRLWIGTNTWGTGGVSRYDGTSFTNLTVEDGLAFDIVTALTEDHHGNIWIGTRWGDGGVSRYDGNGFTNFTVEDGLVNNNVVSMMTDTQGHIWIGTESGLSKYDGTMFTTLPEFAGKSISTIIQDGRGQLWFGTANGGVIRMDGKAWTQMTTADGLPSNRVSALREDKAENIWIGTAEGLTKYTLNSTPPLIHIESIVADQVYTAPKKISLPAGTKNLRINYKAVSFITRPEAMQYFYQLEGQGGRRSRGAMGSAGASPSQWQGPTHERSVDYLNLKPGTYTFKAKAVNRDLVYSEPASVTVKVVPPFYMQAGFLLPTVSLCTIIIAALIIVLIGYVKHFRQVQTYQRAAVEELKDARKMQMSLMPESAPPFDGVEIAGKCVPANTVGGDFFDYLSLNGKIGIALADVSGKGLKAAMNAVLANGMLHEVAKMQVSCGKILSAVNADLCPRMEKGMFTALGLAIIDQDAKVIQWANAAQPYPLVKRGEQVFELKSETELPLGMMRNIAYPDSQLELQVGDITIFYTDGLIEAENKIEEMYGTERLEQVVRNMNPAIKAQEIIETILQDVTNFVGDAKQYDDMTVVVLKKI